MSIDVNNDKFEHSLESLRKIGETINNMQVPLRQIAENVQKTNQVLISAVQSAAVQNVLQLGQSIATLFSSCDFTPMLKKFSESFIPIRYIHLLEELRWPLFLINDDALREQILTECVVNEDADAVKDIVFEYCDEAFFVALEEDWLACSAIDSARKPILSEAIALHKQGCYYASVSTLMCQVYGIAADIDHLAKANDLVLDQEGKEFAAEHFKVDINHINNEKGRLLQSLMLTESGILLWNAMGDYIKNVTLYSGKDYSHIENQPLRNKIGHGDQLNFGTQEHSLKAILTIDMLIQLAYEINRIAELRSNTAELSKEQDNGTIRCDEGCDQPRTEG